MHYSNDAVKPRGAQRRAAVFVDYENLYSYLHRLYGARSRPEEIIGELIRELRRHLSENSRTIVTQIAAYADFSGMQQHGQRIQQALYLDGIEPRFVPASMQRNAAEIQLCVDAVETSVSRQDVQTIVIASGDRLYLPLVQHCLRRGLRPVVATLSPPSSTSHFAEQDVFLDAAKFLDDAPRRPTPIPSPGHRSTVPPSAPPPPPVRRRTPAEYREIDHPGARHALEIIDEYFGQYEEVYLTPLLRKLSELLDETRYDPKSLISELESAGAVWLKKRPGIPHDYTVLLIDPDHPDVQAVKTSVHRSPSYSRDARYDDGYEAESAGYADSDDVDREGYAEPDYDENLDDRQDAYSDTAREGDDAY